MYTEAAYWARSPADDRILAVPAAESAMAADPQAAEVDANDELPKRIANDDRRRGIRLVAPFKNATESSADVQDLEKVRRGLGTMEEQRLGCLP